MKLFKCKKVYLYLYNIDKFRLPGSLCWTDSSKGIKGIPETYGEMSFLIILCRWNLGPITCMISIGAWTSYFCSLDLSFFIHKTGWKNEIVSKSYSFIPQRHSGIKMSWPEGDDLQVSTPKRTFRKKSYFKSSRLLTWQQSSWITAKNEYPTCVVILSTWELISICQS